MSYGRRNGTTAVNIAVPSRTMETVFKASNFLNEPVAINQYVTFSGQTFPNAPYPLIPCHENVIGTLPLVGNQIVPVGIFVNKVTGNFKIHFSATVASLTTPQVFAVAFDTIPQVDSYVTVSAGSTGVSLDYTTRVIPRGTQITIVNVSTTAITLPALSGLPNANLSINLV